MGEGVIPDPDDSIPAIESVLQSLGCPVDKSRVMASQLDKRARQLSDQKGKSYEQALQHLLSVVKSGVSGDTSPPPGN